ncbi:MAG: ATP-binding protein [Bacteroidota bacterium]|nr:ATP-binding protein [Bacteroidota bacterium]
MSTISLHTIKKQWKLGLFISAIIIGYVSLWYTNNLVKRLSYEESKKVELWAEATRMLSETAAPNVDLNFLLKVIENNNTVPVILTDENEKIIYTRNLDSLRVDMPGYQEKELLEMKAAHSPLVVDLENAHRNYIFYKDSLLLQKLRYYPYIQLFVVVVFIVVSFIAFSSSRKAEQNKVWLGLSRETAHQLGTPTSSLMAWLEILKAKVNDDKLIVELEKDVHRLNLITERFSKIGSQPVLEICDLNKVISEVVVYMRRRKSELVNIDIESESFENYIPLNNNLFSWVIENLIKNALDAVPAQGNIKITILNKDSQVIVDIVDNGKGIPKRNFKKIFKPGFTTKSRGWGLGLSLTKRIIEEYHKGKIFVLRSEIDKGTAFRIILPVKKV